MLKRPPKSSGRLFAEPESPSARLEGAYSANIDGAARGNPGPASYGVVIRRPDGTPLESLGRRLMDDFDIVSSMGTGTTVTMSKWLR